MKSLSSSFRRGTKDKPSDPNATPKDSKVKRSVSLSTTKVAFGSRQSKGEAGAPAQSGAPRAVLSPKHANGQPVHHN